jgi:hypothetical protein
VLNQRIACSLIPEDRKRSLPVMPLICKLTPTSLCCMESSEIEKGIDKEVCIRVHNEVVQETMMNPGPVVATKYYEWKARVGKKRCV